MSYAGQGKKARIRINTDKTDKGGYRYESTVEVEGPFDSEADMDLLQGAIREGQRIAREEGMAEVTKRNALEGRETPFNF